MNSMRVEVLAVDVADFVDGDDVRVLQPGRGLGLGAEALQVVVRRQRAGEDHFQGDDAVERSLPGLVDDAHAAAADLGQQLVIAEGSRNRCCVPPGDEASCMVLAPFIKRAAVTSGGGLCGWP